MKWHFTADDPAKLFKERTMPNSVNEFMVLIAIILDTDNMEAIEMKFDLLNELSEHVRHWIQDNESLQAQLGLICAANEMLELADCCR